MPKKRSSTGQVLGGIIAGIDHQIFRNTPPADELVAKGAPIRAVAAAGGGTLHVSLPGDPGSADDPDRMRLSAAGVDAQIDLRTGGRLASFAVDGLELLVTEGYGPIMWGSYPMAPYAGRVREGRFDFDGRRWQLPITMPPHAIHGMVLDRAWQRVDDVTIATELGPDWPFAGRAVQRFDLVAGRLTCRLEVHADEPMPASIGWHPWFRRRLAADAPPVELEFDAGMMLRRGADGIPSTERIPPPPGPWDDCFTDVLRPPILRWPGLLELTVASDCPWWVVYTVPNEALCVEPQTAPPDALNTGAAIVEPGRPLVAEMTWSWRSLAAASAGG